MITTQDILTSSGKYVSRATHPECTELVKSNASFLAHKVSGLLFDLGITKQINVSSGFRPLFVNKAIKNAAKLSNHMKGNAVDLEDLDGELGELFLNNLHLLEKHGLYLESPDHTESWAHLQGVPPRSGNRVFIP